MPRLSRLQDDTRRRVADLAARGLTPADLGTKLLAALQGAVPFDGGRLFGIDPDTLLINRVLAATDSDGWARQEWLRDIYLAADPLDYLELPTLMRADLRAVAFHDRQDTCWGYPPALLDRVEPREHHRLFHDLRSPVGGTLHACFPAAGRWVAAMQVYRRAVGHRFSPGEVGFVRLLTPAIGRALQAAFARERARCDADAAPPATGIVLLGADGSAGMTTPAGDAWCGLLSAAERSGHGPLPSAVWSAVAGLRADGDSGASTVIGRSTAGLVRVEASWAGADGSVAVVLSPERPPAWGDVPADWPLTPQQRRLVSMLVQGMSNRQISAALAMSENTVEWHLRNAYDALGVRGRTHLLARLFRETQAPHLSSSC